MAMHIAGTYEAANRAAYDVGAVASSHVRYEDLARGLSGCAIPLGCDGDGVYLAEWHGRHAICSGITGAGKTESVLNTTIVLNALGRDVQSNLFVIDAKGDCFDKTAPILAARGYAVRNIDLRPHRGKDRFNPIHDAYTAFLEGDPAMAQELAGEVAEGLASQIADRQDRYWEGAASALLQAVILALMEDKHKKGCEPTLADVSDLITEGVPALSKLASSVSSTKAGKLLLSAISMRDAKDTVACVLSCALQPLTFYRTMMGREVAGTSTFDVFEDLGAEKPVAYYLCVAGDASEGARVYGSMLFDHIYKTHVRRFISPGQGGVRLRPMRCVWDEFPQHRAVGSVPNVLATARGYDFLVMLAVQSTSQLVANYGIDEARVILSQCEAGLFMRSVDEEINREVALRTMDAVTPAHLVDLETGEAYFALPGKPAVKAKYETFDELVERCGFEALDVEDYLQGEGASEVAACQSRAIGSVTADALLEQCKIAAGSTDFARLANALSQHDSAYEKAGVKKCAAVLADALEYSYLRAAPDCRKAIEACLPSKGGVNPYLAELYLMALEILFEIGRKGHFEDVFEELAAAMEAMANYIEGFFRGELREDAVIDEGPLTLGEQLDKFARIVYAADSNGNGSLKSFKSFFKSGMRVHLMFTRRVLVKMVEDEVECGVPLMRRIALPGPEGDRALNRLRAIRVFGLIADFDVFEKLVLLESQPTLWGAAKMSM
ncbi:MAG: type IV secretory system conjugative DNA transfer family protein [Eggerthellaceae bacterium]|nr:type IV secretory system conjugative DNA transfer family protein [Eggerthellaceae bacterium]